MKTFEKYQPVRLTRQESSIDWSFGVDTITGVYLGINEDPEDAPHVHMVDVRYGQINIVSDEEIEAV